TAVPGTVSDLVSRVQRSLVVTGVAAAIAGCTAPVREVPASEVRALGDSVATLFDSLVAIHQSRPDTALLGRLFPAADTLLYVEGDTARRFTGDSLLRRTLAAHSMVHEMAPRAVDRAVQLLGHDHAIVNAIWIVDVVDTAGQHHPWRGPLTVITARRSGRWVIAGYRE